jgi:hypothetical protein
VLENDGEPDGVRELDAVLENDAEPDGDGVADVREGD